VPPPSAEAHAASRSTLESHHFTPVRSPAHDSRTAKALTTATTTSDVLFAWPRATPLSVEESRP
jgi:hypothetical protein